MPTEMVSSGDQQVFVRHCGDGPLVVLCHGFPETSVCWERHLDPLAAAGFHAAALDLRGMGQSSVPGPGAAYSILAAVGDVLAVSNALGHDRFHLVGNDLGALLAWQTALSHPDRVISVTGLSLPYFARATMPPLDLLAFLQTKTETPYLLRFAEAEAHLEMEADPRAWIEACMASISGRVDPIDRLSGMVPRVGPVSSVFVTGTTADFLSSSELDELASAYSTTGFAGALQWYHRLNADWPDLEPWARSKIQAPCQFIGGEVDPVRLISAGAVNELHLIASDLRTVTWLADVGHWPHLESETVVRNLIIELMISTDAV